MSAAGCEAAIEPAIKDQILLQGIGSGKERANGVGMDQRLGEMPNLSRYSDVVRQRMRYRKGLAKLRAVPWLLNLLGHDGVGIEVEATGIEADQQQRRLAVGANIDIRRRAGIHAPEVAERHGGSMSFSLHDDALQSQGEIAGMPVETTLNVGLNEGLGLREQLQTLNGRKFHDFSEAEAP